MKHKQQCRCTVRARNKNKTHYLQTSRHCAHHHTDIENALTSNVDGLPSGRWYHCENDEDFHGEVHCVKDNLRRERDVVVVVVEWRFFVFMERSVKKCCKHLCVIWLSSNPNVQLGLRCIRVLDKPYYSNINQLLNPEVKEKSVTVRPCVHWIIDYFFVFDPTILSPQQQ